MAVTIINGIFKKETEGYYLAFDMSDFNRVSALGYNPAGKSILSKHPIIDIDTTNPDDQLLIGAFGGKEFSAFIFKAYLAKVNFDGKEGGRLFDLQGSMIKNGRYDYSLSPPIDDFSQLNLLDFMFLTKAKILPEGIAKYIPSAQNPTPEARPPLYEVEDGDKAQMFEAIKSFGFWGIVKLLWAAGGITFDQMIDCLDLWMPTSIEENLAKRKSYFSNTFEVFRINQKLASLSKSEREKFIGI